MLVGWKVDQPRRKGSCICMQGFRPVLPIRCSTDFPGEVCQCGPEQVKVLVGTNSHPLAKLRQQGLSSFGHYNGQSFRREVPNPGLMQVMWVVSKILISKPCPISTQSESQGEAQVPGARIVKIPQ